MKYILSPDQLKFIEENIDLEDVPLQPGPKITMKNICVRCQSDDNAIFNIRTLNDFIDYFKDRTAEEFDKEMQIVHPDGYCFADRLCWNYSKERRKYRDIHLAQESVNIIYWIAMKYPDIFADIFSRQDEDGLTPMSIYMKNITVFRQEDYNFLEFMKMRNVDFEKKDKDGLSAMDYFNLKNTDPNTRAIIAVYQKNLKNHENRVLSHIKEICPEQFRWCEKCKKEMKPFYDLDHMNFDYFIEQLTEQDVWDMIESIILREKINNLYQIYSYNCGDTLVNHVFCINVWKRILLSLGVLVPHDFVVVEEDKTEMVLDSVMPQPWTDALSFVNVEEAKEEQTIEEDSELRETNFDSLNSISYEIEVQEP